MTKFGRRLARLLLASSLLVPILVAKATASEEAGAPGEAGGARKEGVLSDDGRRYMVEVGAESSTGSRSYLGTGIPSPITGGASELAEAAEARPGGGGAAESVIGFDGRVQDTTTTGFPDRATVEILFQKTSGGGTFVCTGFLVGPDTVVTAGHCVHSGSGGSSGFFVRTSYQLRPGRNGATVPYTCPGGVVVGAQRLWTNTGWANAGGETKDYGAIHTTCPIGNTTGWYGYSNTGTSSWNGTAIHTRGYPADKPAGTQWLANNCKASSGAAFLQCTVAATESRQLFYKNDTFGGQSGSPVYRTSAPAVGGCSGTCAYAIHAYGVHGSGNHASNNHGTRIENQVTSFINFVRNGGVTTHN